MIYHKSNCLFGDFFFSIANFSQVFGYESSLDFNSLIRISLLNKLRIWGLCNITTLRFSAADQILTSFMDGHKCFEARESGSFLGVGNLHGSSFFIRLSYQPFPIFFIGERGPLCRTLFGPAVMGSKGARTAGAPQSHASPHRQLVRIHYFIPFFFFESRNRLRHICCICQGPSFVKVLVVQCQHKYICP